jgi:hypothetical protein
MTTSMHIIELNKYKKRHFHTSKNLLTGETDAHPDLARVRGCLRRLIEKCSGFKV